MTLLMILLASFQWAHAVIPGAIPLKPVSQPATDLKYQGRILLPDEALALANQGVDLSRVDPDQTSELWSDNIQQSFPNNLNLKEDDNFEYLGTIPSPLKTFRFSVNLAQPDGTQKQYTLMLSKRVHNVMLRMALLTKLGYKVPPVQYLPRTKITFSSSFAKKAFIEKDAGLKKSAVGAPERWVTNLEDEDSPELHLQDVVVFPASTHSYHLATGVVPAQVIRGRRVLNALAVPYNLVEVPESVNLYDWYPGRIVSNHVYLPYEYGDDFSTTMNDAKWIGRRIAKLSRNDFTEVVREAHYPPEVAALVLERLVSRRNKLKDLLLKEECIDAPAGASYCYNLEFNPNISMGEHLRDGKLLKEDWDGYGARFAYGDKEPPLSWPEIRAFLKSKTISSVLASLVSHINTNIIPRTDIQRATYEHQLDLAVKRFADFIRTGKMNKTEFGFWTKPIFSGNLIAGREIVAGSYLGTDNRIQLADTVGFAIDGGYHIGTHGLNPGQFMAGHARAYVSRTYTHLKPIVSMKAALKEPFKNILVPLLKRNYATYLNEFVDGSLDELEQEDKQKKIEELLSIFKSHVGIGESLIITDSLIGSLGLQGGESLSDHIKLQAAINASQKIISRLHIFRASDDVFHIYDDRGNFNILEFSIGLDGGIQVIEFRAKRISGKAKVRYHQLNLASSMEKNPGVIESAHALHYLFLQNSTELIPGKPYVLSHRIKETSSGLNLLFWRNRRVKGSDEITIESPSGTIQTFITRRSGERSGKNYQSLVVDVLGEILSRNNVDDVVIANTTSGNPGDTLFGESQSRQSKYEGKILSSDFAHPLDENFMQINYVWKGWQKSKSKMLKLIDKAGKKFSVELYPHEALHETTAVQLYSLKVSINIYEEGIRNLANVSEERIRRVFRKYGDFPPTVPNTRRGARFRRRMLITSKFLDNQAIVRNMSHEIGVERVSKAVHDMVATAEALLPFEIFLELIGGSDNVFLQSVLQGFRVGDEDGDQPLISHTLGELGSRKWDGPLTFVQKNTGMTESEFFIYWIFERL